MSATVCYIELEDRGAWPTRLLLVGLHGVRVWAAPRRSADADPRFEAQAAAAGAAEWLIDSLVAVGGPSAGRIDRLCIDGDGATCAWFDAQGLTPAVLRAEAERAVGGEGGDEGPGFEVAPRLPELPGELSLEPLWGGGWEAGAGGASGNGGGGGGGHGGGGLLKAARSWIRPTAGAAGAGRGGKSGGSGGAGGTGGTGGTGGAGGAGLDDGAGRAAVLALPELWARLLVDELDRRGVACGRVVSLWHAMSAVWDSAEGPASEGGRADLINEPAAPRVSATVVIESGAGIEAGAGAGAESGAGVGAGLGRARLVWCWSRGGRVIATGSQRLAVYGESVGVTRAGIGRMMGDWLSWASQLGVGPERVVCVAPGAGMMGGGLDGQLESPALTGSSAGSSAGASGAGDAAGLGLEGLGGAGLGGAGPGGQRLDWRGLGAAMSAGWPGAVIDLVDHADPVGLTLRRLCERADAGRDPAAMEALGRASGAALVGLSNRPGRVHRRMYWSAAAALVVGSLVPGIIGWRLHAAAGRERALIGPIREAQRVLAEGAAPNLGPGPIIRQLNDELKKLGPPTPERPPFSEPPPVLAALEDITFFLATQPDVQLLEVKIGTAQALYVRLLLPTVESTEQLMASLASFRLRHVTLSNQSRSRSGERFQQELTFLWTDAERYVGGPL